MEFVDNTGHIFSLPSYNKKPIGYEYDEYSYVFWIDSNNTSKLSVNNFYSEPIYALYELNKDFSIDELEDDLNPIINIEIYTKESNVFKLISSKELQKSISNENFKLTDYVNLNMFEKDNDEYIEKYNFIKESLTNKDLYCVKTEEIKYANEQDTSGTLINYLMIPIYPIAMSTESGTWITNIMIHIHNNSINKDEWCYISVGGEFVDEYEELIINGKNMGVSLPKDILKSIYPESLYNCEYNEALFNEKMKEYMLNYMNIKGEIGNFKSAIDSLKWFEYGDKISISKLLKTDNEFKKQYLLDYFDISNDILISFRTFVSQAFVSLMIHINKETDKLYPFEFKNDHISGVDIENEEKFFYGENKPKLISLIDNYTKIKIGNHDMPIENDIEKYWYWKPYFDFSFNELGIKLVCLSYYYKKYFLPIHLNVHSTSLGYTVFTNDIKLTNNFSFIESHPSIVLNNHKHVIFKGKGIHYFTKQIHYIDEYFNEFYLGNIDIENDNREWYYLNDTCVNIPIEFVYNDFNKGYYNCVFILQKAESKETIYESHFSFYQNDSQIYKNFIIYPKKLNVKINKNKNDYSVTTNYFEYWVDNDFIIKLLVNNTWHIYEFKLKIHNPTIDFGILKYRYYLNDRNYFINRLFNDADNPIHNLLFCDASDIYKINNDNTLPTSITNIKDINQKIYNKFKLNTNKSFIQSFDISNPEYLYQYFKENYSLYSPFKQIKYMNDENNTIIFNSYMHNAQLVNMNEINFDINFYKILQYHLDHNLLYIDGTLLDNEFYQYIIFTDDNGNKHDVYIHKDLIGYNIKFFLYDNKNILICAHNGNIYILVENYDNEDNNYSIMNMNNNDEHLFIDENYESLLIYDTICLNYDYTYNIYYSPDPNNVDAPYDPENENQVAYEIYDKLYSNTDKIYSKYSSLVNLPNNLKYKNSIHMFGLYTSNISEHNILIFHNNINMHIDGIRFIHYTTVDADNDEELKIYLDGNLQTFIDTRYPDTYGLYWTSLFDDRKPILPEEKHDIMQNYGIYVKRNYDLYFNDNVKMWELPNLMKFDTNEFTYYKEKNETCIGSLVYKTLNNFYSNIVLENQLIEEYKDIEIILDKEKDAYYFIDKEIRNLDNLNEYYKNYLTYEIQFIDENNNQIDVSVNNINNYEYDKIIITFYYKKTHIVRNRFYMISDYLKYLDELYGNDNYIAKIIQENNKNYLKIIYNSRIYKIELINFKEKYIYVNKEYNHNISNQNPSMYWYNMDNESIESLPSYLNNIERYLFNENETIDNIISSLDTYVHLQKQYGRYSPDNKYARYNFNNYLIKDLTGIKGQFKMNLITNIENEDNIVHMYIECINNGSINIYENYNELIEFNGDEEKITLYIQFYNNEDLTWYYDINSDSNTYIIPKLIKIFEDEKRLQYIPEESTSYNEYGPNLINVKYLNKEFSYGDNDNEYVYNLYNEFFKLKFNIYDIYINDTNINSKLLGSVYDYNDSIKLDTYLNYDFYLMHDDKYWYGLYISQETCDKIRNNKDLRIKDKDRKKRLNNLILNYERSSEEYLLNRLEFNTSEGFNQFKDDDIVCCYLHNNDRLPFNVGISSKWKIEPMSLGMSVGTSFDSNGEMTILSLPKNNSKYEHGYYKVTVKYSLDRDIQHQFKNTSTIRIS